MKRLSKKQKMSRLNERKSRSTLSLKPSEAQFGSMRIKAPYVRITKFISSPNRKFPKTLNCASALVNAST